MFALYSVLTRLTTRDEPFFAAFFWPPVIGAVLMTVIGLPHWQSIAPVDWVYLMAYAGISVASNWLLQKTYEAAEASVVQPFAYLQIVFVTVIGIVVYGEVLRVEVAIGAGLVVLAGLYALTVARKEAKA
jgi:drug/metabolite transporter (DMT)-like permease